MNDDASKDAAEGLDFPSGERLRIITTVKYWMCSDQVSMLNSFRGQLSVG